MGKVFIEPIQDEMRTRKNMSTLPVRNVNPPVLSHTLLTNMYVCAEADEEVSRVASE